MLAPDLFQSPYAGAVTRIGAPPRSTTEGSRPPPPKPRSPGSGALHEMQGRSQFSTIDPRAESGKTVGNRNKRPTAQSDPMAAEFPRVSVAPQCPVPPKVREKSAIRVRADRYAGAPPPTAERHCTAWRAARRTRATDRPRGWGPGEVAGPSRPLFPTQTLDRCAQSSVNSGITEKRLDLPFLCAARPVAEPALVLPLPVCRHGTDTSR